MMSGSAKRAAKRAGVVSIDDGGESEVDAEGGEEGEEEEEERGEEGGMWSTVSAVSHPSHPSHHTMSMMDQTSGKVDVTGLRRIAENAENKGEHEGGHKDGEPCVVQ